MRNRRDQRRYIVILILAIAGLITGTTPFTPLSEQVFAQAAAPGWSYTGSLNAPRVFHTATLLPNGKVLVAGGINGDNILNSAELYDPITGSWTPTGNLNVAREGHTATLLPNGKVLVVGGYTRIQYPPGLTNTAELYDPATGAWSLTSNMNKPRAWHSATLLQNGKVFIEEGYGTDDDDCDKTAYCTAELYDPEVGMWTLTSGGILGPGRAQHTATLLQDGNVLVAGGYVDLVDEGFFSHGWFGSEFYDPSVGTWSVTANLKTGRFAHTATLLPSGNVLAAGGSDVISNRNGDNPTSNINSAELYNPATRTWRYTGSLNAARAGHTATLLPSSNVLVAGGDNLGSAELYDSTTGNWSATASLNTPRSFHTATLLSNGKVLVAGGMDGRGAVVSSAELYGSSSFANPIDDPQFFVRQQYMDFLDREPDPPGFAGWMNILNNCGVSVTQPCDRIEVSADFFRSPEFQGRGYFIFRFYIAGLGRNAFFKEFMPDLRRVSGFLDDTQLEAAKVAFVNDFVSRSEFQQKYDSITDPAAYVDAILSTAGVSLSQRQQLIDDLAAGRNTRAGTLRAIIESQEVYNKYYNTAFVVMQYFGYLRRDPDILYLDWIKTMNDNGGDYRVMINGFINSTEYRQRFGS